MSSDSMNLCPCCTNNDIQNPSEPAVHYYCPSCGHRWRKTNQDVERYYYVLKNRNAMPVQDIERKLMDRLTDIVPFLREDCRILEVGCAEGQLGLRIKKVKPVDYTGVELSVDADAAEKVLDKVIRTSSRSVAEIYDVLLSFHTLEHINNIYAEVAHWRGLLRETGVAIIEVPNESGHRFLSWDANPEHLHQFTATSLTALFSHCSFDLIRLTSGHFESPVYNNSLRIFVCPRLAVIDRQNSLLKRFHDFFPGHFIVYGIGGDFRNYVAPFLNSLPIVYLVDSNPNQQGKKIGHLTVVDFDLIRESDLPILISSIRFNNEIYQLLLGKGVAASRIISLREIYGTT